MSMICTGTFLYGVTAEHQVVVVLPDEMSEEGVYWTTANEAFEIAAKRLREAKNQELMLRELEQDSD